MLVLPTRIVFIALVLAVVLSPVAQMAERSSSTLISARPSQHQDSRNARRIDSTRRAFLRTPLRFERSPLAGRAATDVVARGAGYAVYLSGGNATIILRSPDGERSHTIRMRLVGSRTDTAANPGRELPGHSNHFIGNDQREWKTRVPSYGTVEYSGVYPGVDLIYYGNQQQLEYDFVVAPGAEPSRIGFKINGADNVRIDRTGSLLISTKSGTLVQHAPKLYQEVDGERRQVAGRYAIDREGTIRFEVGEYDNRHALVIDPVLSYATYFGGANQERIHATSVDADGSVIVVGETYSSDLPITNPFQTERAGFGDAFVAKLNPAGDALVFATYFGGNREDAASAIEVGAAGDLYVVGSTFSSDFPTLSGYQALNRGQSDVFVAKIDATGALVYSTLFGGALEEYATGIAVDSQGRARVVGSTMSADLPIVAPLQSSLGGAPVHRTIDAGETWSARSAGLRATGATAFAIDPASPGTVYAATQFEGVFKTTDGGLTWAPTGADLLPWQVYALALGDGLPATVYAATQAGVFRSRDGGESWTLLEISGSVNAIVVDRQAPSTVYAGLTSGFPSAGVFKSTDGGDTWTATGLSDSVFALAISGSTLYAATSNGVFTSAVGGLWSEANAGLTSQVSSLVVDPANPSIAYAGNFDGLFKTTNGGGFWEASPIFVGVPVGALAMAPSDPSTLYLSVLWGGSAITNDGGENWRPTFSESGIATTIAVDPHSASTAYIGVLLNRDGFTATVSADGRSLEFSTYFGGSGHDEISDVALDSNGATYIVGKTTSPDLTVLNAVQYSFAGVQDAFAARIRPDLSLAYSTYLGGTGAESTASVGVDLMGQAHVAGLTWSINYPTVNAHQPQAAGGYSDLFVSVLNAEGSAFVYSTYLGGNDLETNSTQSLGPDVAVAPEGDTYITGTTMSRNFPTTADAFQRVHAGGPSDAFVTKLDSTGRLHYSTFLGGSGDDHGRSIALDAEGGFAVAGYTNSMNFPVPNGLHSTNAGTDDGFIARFTAGTSPSDTVAPVTTIGLTGTSGLSGWYRSPVVVTLSASDGESGSGIAHVQYRVNGGPLQTYSAPFTISAQGTTEIRAYATDAAGNVEAPAPSASFMIDSLSPTMRITSPEARDYLYSQTLTVAVAASDSMSGLAGPAAVALDGAPLSGSTIDLTTLTLGPHTLVASAADHAGNSAQAQVTFRVVAEIDRVINVPSEATTIQAAITRAVDGDTVLVAPGTYAENIDFLGKAITVVSEQGADRTIIDGGGRGTVVTFRSGEKRTSVLSGFTIRGGLATHFGGGIWIASASPTIRQNVVTENRSCSGVGIYSSFGSPLIEKNRITKNSISGCTGGWGVGVYIGGDSSAEIIDNEISDNTGQAATGGGLALFAAGNAVVRGNVIRGNATAGAAGCGWGGGLASANFSQAKIVNNLIVGNSACFAAGVYWLGSTGSTVFVNNTIAGNHASAAWAGMYVSGFDARNALYNNIIAAASGPAIYCENAASVSSPVFNSNDIFSAGGAAYGGSCADRTALDGNLSADPRFLGAASGDFRVAMASPVIDAGNDAAPHLPLTDAAGTPRVVDGNGDGTARVDIGALEYRNQTPVVDAGADQVVTAGSGCLAPVTLSGTASDPDGDPLTLTWTGPFGTLTGATASVILPVGTHMLRLTATDASGASIFDTVAITVLDTTRPVITSASATPSVLVPPNREMVPVAISVEASDSCGAAVTCRIASVTSNEPVEGAGEGDKGPDWEITGPLTLTLRAERLGKGTGRVYTIQVVCSDASGNSASSVITVTVPR